LKIGRIITIQTSHQNSLSYQDIIAELLERQPEYKIHPTLDRVSGVLKLLGDPQNKFKAVHITGTNGKTSTSYMVDNILREHGFLTAKFTSPHLLNVTERIQIGGKPISEHQLTQVYHTVMPKVKHFEAENLQLGLLSFFEVLTVMAYAIFAAEQVDVAVVEVGVGGRFDATNVLENKVVAVIMPIGLDHMNFLGDTVEEITTEKAGIMRPELPVVVAKQVPEVMQVLRNYCTDHFGTDSITVVEPSVDALNSGNYLLHNAEVAVAVAQIAYPRIGQVGVDNSSIKQFDAQAAHRIALETQVPGRLHYLQERPTVLGDVAHNPHGAVALVEVLKAQYPEASTSCRVAVVAMFADKDASEFLKVLAQYFTYIVTCANSSERTLAGNELHQVATNYFELNNISSASTVSQAVEVAKQMLAKQPHTDSSADNGLIVVTGSVVTVADYLTSLLSSTQVNVN
jgi:dihydrofolate synthase/folylpolyglutamate synthase